MVNILNFYTHYPKIMGIEKLFKPLNHFLDTPKRGLLALILPMRKENGQNQTSGITGAGTMHSPYTTRNENGKRIGQQLEERKMRKEDRRSESKLAGKRRERPGRFLLAGRGFGNHNSCSLSVIIVLGLKKRRIVFPSVSPNVTRVVLH